MANGTEQIIKSSSWMYTAVTTFIKNINKNEEVNVSDSSGWTDAGSEKKVLDKVNGEKGKTTRHAYNDSCKKQP